MSQPIIKATAGIAALAAIAFGASAIASSGKSPTSPAAAGMPGAPGMRGAPPQGPNGAPPPGMGAPVTGAIAEKVKAAAIARYPGTIERIEAMPDGSYIAHVVRSGGSEVHVIVNRQFQVAGTATFPGRGRPSGAPGAPGAPVAPGVSD
jgi:hypothetical protein